jgi:hypothetical protein
MSRSLHAAKPRCRAPDITGQRNAVTRSVAVPEKEAHRDAKVLT